MTAPCPECGDRNLAIVRCSHSAPSPICDAPGSPHTHVVCGRCDAQHVELPDASELAALACWN